MGVYEKDGNWFIDLHYRGRRIRKKIGPNKRQAETVLKKTKVAIAENKYLDIKRQQKILFEEMAEEYLKRYSRVNKKSFVRDETSIKNLKDFFGGKYLYEITPLSIEDYKAKRKEKTALATVNRELACLKHIFTKAIEWGRASENPVKKVKLFKENNQRVRFLEKGQIALLLAACPEFLKPIVIVALNTGMRQGEILRLTWDDIDFTRGIISVRNTKNNERRFIPMNTVVDETLRNLKTNCNLDSPYVFGNEKGRPLTRFGVIRGAFRRAIKEAGIRDFRFHDLRHTFASHLVMAGTDIMTVKELLGHKTLAMTLRYSHLSPKFKRSTVELLCKKMDTFWTLERNKEKVKKVEFPESIVNKRLFDEAGMAELADARDLKSRALQRV